MDVFDEELLKLWRTLINNQVNYLMVGGVAVNLQDITELPTILIFG